MEGIVLTAANWTVPTLPRALAVPTAPACWGRAGFFKVDTCARNTNTSTISTADSLCLALLPVPPTPLLPPGEPMSSPCSLTWRPAGLDGNLTPSPG